jgi:mono/diheme cytochrome c family protein
MSSRLGKGAALIVGVTLALTAGAARGAAQEPDGGALYRQHCRACHGAKGVPPQRMLTIYSELKPLADSGAFAKLPADSIIAAMRHGKGTRMKAFTEELSADQMTAIAKFIKTL